MKAHLKKFNLQHAIHAIFQHQRINKQKTKKVLQFEAHFGRKCNTPVSNISTKSNSKNLKYNKLINYYLDEATKPGRYWNKL